MADELENVVEENEETEETPVSEIPYPEGTAPPEEDPITFDPYIEDGVARGYDPDTLLGAIFNNLTFGEKYPMFKNAQSVSDVLPKLWSLGNKGITTVKDLLNKAYIIPNPSVLYYKRGSGSTKQPLSILYGENQSLLSIVYGITDGGNSPFPSRALTYNPDSSVIGGTRYAIFNANTYPVFMAVIVTTGSGFPTNTLHHEIKWLDSFKFSFIAEEECVVPAGNGVCAIPVSYELRFKPEGEDELVFTIPHSAYMQDTIFRELPPRSNNWKRSNASLRPIATDLINGQVYMRNESDTDVTIAQGTKFLWVTDFPTLV